MPAPNANPTGGIEDFTDDQIAQYDKPLSARVGNEDQAISTNDNMKAS